VIKLQGKLPRKIWLACSGGVDSMAALDFLRRNHEVQVIHFDHKTAHAALAREFVKEQCAKYNLPLMIGEPEASDLDFPDPRKSKEEQYRELHYYLYK
jgi:tRNA(Ile)-lysidine synthase TilS/MesJ